MLSLIITSLVFNEKHRDYLSVEDVAVAIIDKAKKPKNVRKRFTDAY
ncbi:hypothetical protein [Mucilaginibacter antarcticus]|uniref:Uncharacterized protein n=1 Tax=Mucilaginibacter antarcticus TaxID=1855725 RepID=A0ABW5XQL8_9SPHI